MTDLAAALLRAETAEALLEEARDEIECLRVRVAHLEQCLNEEGKGAPEPPKTQTAGRSLVQTLMERMSRAEFDRWYCEREVPDEELRMLLDPDPQWPVKHPARTYSISVTMTRSPIDGDVTVKMDREPTRGNARYFAIPARTARNAFQADNPMAKAQVKKRLAEAYAVHKLERVRPSTEQVEDMFAALKSMFNKETEGPYDL